MHHSVTLHSRQDRLWTAWGFCMDQWTIYCLDYLCAGSMPISSSEKSCITSGSRNPLNSETPSVLNIWFIQQAEDYARWGHNVNNKPTTWTSWYPTWRRAERHVSQWAPMSSLYFATAHLFGGFVVVQHRSHCSGLCYCFVNCCFWRLYTSGKFYMRLPTFILRFTFHLYPTPHKYSLFGTILFHSTLQ